MWRALRIPLASAKTARSHHPTIALLSATTAMGLVAAASSSSSASVASNAGAPEKIALSPKEFRAFKVRSVEAVTHDTKHVVFDLPSAEHEMGLTVASCLMARAEINGESVVRPYTPVNATDTKGVLELVVKGYPTGKMSKHIVNLSVGDTLEMKGPFEKFKYKANEYKTITFLAGGSGITPLLQIVKEIVRNPDDTTRLVLIYANKEERDIILRDELDALVRMYPQFSVHYVLSDPPANGWTGRVGYITKDLVQDLVPPPSATDAWVLVCGPPPMMEALSGDKNPDKSQGDLRGLLKDLQYTSKQVYKY